MRVAPGTMESPLRGSNRLKAIGARLGWKSFGILVSLAIASFAFISLSHALKGVDFAEVLAAMRLTHPAAMALSLGLVAVSYASLTLYDRLALFLIGRGDIPFRIAALASFTSYPIAHGTGAVLLVSSAIRYRIYAPHGIGAADVARICFLTGLTFWLGNLTALGLSVLYEPEAISRIDHLSPLANSFIALSILIGIVFYVCWTWSGRRQMGRRQWSVKLPSGRNVFLQIGIGLVDLGAAALAMYVLMPVGLDIGIARVVVVFIAATLLGFASHAPAGIGVFDATILIGLGGQHTEALLATLLLFRLFYHLTPFVLSLLLFGAVEAWRNAMRRSVSPAA
jgi:uncharacterized membrane protein YbhN (UPF0104 family)